VLKPEMLLWQGMRQTEYAIFRTDFFDPMAGQSESEKDDFLPTTAVN
jgi:hypothetical protein